MCKVKNVSHFNYIIGRFCGVRLGGSLFKNVEFLQSYKNFIETLAI
ncbi:hypothetical protein bthur0001_30030 [Bacillus thuringiensis serovar tochigiensis BGSC 4Y1]|nr:hypothetical protein bthur0001_30030 [Bacillus thuringiensis serovar tochigiensis BGSC 4Y1]